ncbi:MFS transporter [Streptomyces sp. NPDC101455]|uniref:MFS transporter n=1 Tax=Streptomyces sp. NPDC101455 TaxID=3366142 RepID=UPI00380F5DF1
MATDAPTHARHAAAPSRHTRHSPVWILIGASLGLKAAGFSWDYLSYYVTDGTGHSTTAAGAVLTVFGGGWCTGLAVAGTLTDRLGQRTALTLLMALSSLACAALALAHTLPALICVAFCLGLTMEVHRPAVSASINASIPTEAGRARAQAWLYWSSNVGIAICGGLGGYLADGDHYQQLFIASGIACLLFALIARRVLTPRTFQANREDTTYRQVLADPSLRWTALAALGALICAWGLVSVLPLLMTSDGLPPSSYGLAMLANTGAVLVLTPPLTRLFLGREDTLRYPFVPILAVGCSFLGLAMSLASLQHTTLGYAIAAALLVPGEIALSTALGAYISTRAPAGATGRYQAVLSGATAVASLTPLGIAWALHAGGRPLVAVLLMSSALVSVAACRPLAASLRLAHAPGV